MPTTSQNKVMAHVTGKSTRKRGKVVLKQYKMEPSHQFDTLTSSVEDNCPESTDDQVTTVVQADQLESKESTESSQARESERLHQLGFWNSVDKKDIKVKKIGVAAQEKPTGESEEVKQYNEVISQEVERKVDEKLDCPSVKRRAPPELVTSAVCFELKGSVATHVEVLSKMKEMLCYRKGSKIITIQFVPKSRWIIVLDSQETRDRLAGMEFFIGRHSVLLRRYDDVMKMEYKKYLRGQGLLEMVHSATK
ncbi:uncharacterized protein LOC110447676 [Mizuhopecten yessoensis]|uniref:Uncharacterized protein n=1 Tax=Mizuhopecten yessoensis TaxID=6573 RepID=A0A210QUS9_MIZYE|nr:uncharacterized protein LOC110447676 [Mizuhopecten yessoensis]OWF52481.1 hypothetical protein KP79_PYT06861 [Mizuhopecten yessoensis]